MVNKDGGGGDNFWILCEGTKLLWGEHRAHGRSPPPLGKTLYIDNAYYSKIPAMQPFIFSVSHHFWGWKNENTWITFEVTAGSCSNVLERVIFRIWIQICKQFYVWRRYHVKMTRHLNTWERVSEKVDDVISCSKCLKSCTGSLCAKFGFVWVKGGKVIMGQTRWDLREFLKSRYR